MNDWTLYEPAGSDFVPMARWGRDHWSTLLYLETCAVDRHGMIDTRRMRCHPRLHREFVAVVCGRPSDGSAYPTRLRDGELPDHDDWSCLEDMAAAGLLKAWWREIWAHHPFANSEARVELTPLGLRLVADIRAHKARGGNCGDFVPVEMGAVK